MDTQEKDKLTALKLEHRKLDWQVKKLEGLTPYAGNKIKVLKKQKLKVKDLIELIEQLENV
jgi:uncharacterized protein YdcH (DUF465 family)